MPIHCVTINVASSIIRKHVSYEGCREQAKPKCDVRINYIMGMADEHKGVFIITADIC